MNPFSLPHSNAIPLGWSYAFSILLIWEGVAPPYYPAQTIGGEPHHTHQEAGNGIPATTWRSTIIQEIAIILGDKIN